jgi:hypothetical protein
MDVPHGCTNDGVVTYSFSLERLITAEPHVFITLTHVSDELMCHCLDAVTRYKDDTKRIVYR